MILAAGSGLAIPGPCRFRSSHRFWVGGSSRARSHTHANTSRRLTATCSVRPLLRRTCAWPLGDLLHDRGVSMPGARSSSGIWRPAWRIAGRDSDWSRRLMYCGRELRAALGQRRGAPMRRRILLPGRQFSTWRARCGSANWNSRR